MQNQMCGQTLPQANNRISSSAGNSYPIQNSGYKDLFYQLEQAIGADVQRIRDLLSKGIISQQQGQYLMTQLARKAQDINNYKNSNIRNFLQKPYTALPSAGSVLNPMALFNQEHPGFFDGEGRSDVLNYLKDYDMDKDEIVRISQLMENLENAAVDRYLKKSAYEKSLNDENSAAKSKLTAYAQNASSDSNANRIFTREDIGNMSGEEFTRNEKLIMEQLRQGLIK